MKTKGKQMTNWTNIKIDLDCVIKTIEDIDCETAKLEDNEDKLNYLYAAIQTNITQKYAITSKNT